MTAKGDVPPAHEARAPAPARRAARRRESQRPPRVEVIRRDRAVGRRRGTDVLAGLGAARTAAVWTLRTAAARYARDQARYLGGRPPYVTGRPMPGAPGQDAPRARLQPRRM
jgi:hypothetical protein